MILQAGQQYQTTHLITDAEIQAFAAVSGDHNPVHLDEEYARQTPFGARIAHGMFLGGLLSGILGTKFPGPGSIYLSQSLKFLRPAYLGETITLKITVLDVRADKPIVRLSTQILNQDGQTILEGEAVAKVPGLELREASHLLVDGSEKIVQ